MQKITPFLWFDDNAEDAVKFYVSVFDRSKIQSVTRYDESSAKASGMKKGSVMTMGFALEGQEFAALNGGPVFKFTPAISLFVYCSSEKELDRRWKKLSKGGKVMMKLGKYPFSKKYGWVQDRYGVSWQLILGNQSQKISPALLFVKEQAGKALNAMKFYTSLFKNSKIESMARDEKTNVILHGRFRLAGQEFIAFESPIEHEFRFSPAISFAINCKTQDEIDHFWGKLTKGGNKKAQQCGWLADRYDISWQVVPIILPELLGGKEAESVMRALIKMKKLDISKLKKAYGK